MQIATIQGEKRPPGGRSVNQRLRRRGMLPAVVYGHGEAAETLALRQHDVELALKQLAHVVKVSVDGQETVFLLKDVQYDHLMKTPIHLDLMRVSEHERVRTRVAIEAKGKPAGLSLGGEVIHVMADLEVECPYDEIPDAIRPRIDHLNLNEALYVRDLELPAGVTALAAPDAVVLTVRPMKTVAVTAAPAEGQEGPAEPELVGRTAKEKPAEEGD